MVSELTAVRTAADLKAPISGSSSLAGVNCPADARCTTAPLLSVPVKRWEAETQDERGRGFNHSSQRPQ